MRWAAVAAIGVIVLASMVAWLIGEVGWREAGGGWEQRLNLNLWPPSVCWVSRPIAEPNEIGEGDPPLLTDPSRVQCPFHW
jgi:hypothetical protein